MPTYTVTEKRGPWNRTGITLTGGKTFSRKFWVNTRDNLAAASATGVPRVGEALDAVAYPGLIVTSVESSTRGGTDSGSGTGGLSEVVVTYSQPSYQWGDAPKEVQPPGVKHTVFLPASSTVEIGSGYQPDYVTEYIDRYNNNKPANKIIGQLVVEVYDFRPLTYTVPYQQMLSLVVDKRINSDTITLPPPLGLAQSMPLNPHQALYLDFRVEARPDSILIVHRLELRGNWLRFWAIPNKDGRIVSVGVGSDFTHAPYSGLW